MARADDIGDVLEEFEELDKALYEEYRDRCYTVLAQAEELGELLNAKKTPFLCKQKRHLARKRRS